VSKEWRSVTYCVDRFRKLSFLPPVDSQGHLLPATTQLPTVAATIALGLPRHIVANDMRIPPWITPPSNMITIHPLLHYFRTRREGLIWTPTKGILPHHFDLVLSHQILTHFHTSPFTLRTATWRQTLISQPPIDALKLENRNTSICFSEVDAGLQTHCLIKEYLWHYF
jgi:hypothetical protein